MLASGDPFFFGVGTMLMRRFSPAEMLCLPAPSAFALAAARLGWSEQDCAMLSLHGRPLEAIIPHLQPGARILALSWDGTTPGKLAALLAARGMGRSKLTVCEAMGGPRERIRTAEAESFALDDVADLNTIALEVAADRDAPILPRAPGLPDDWFEHDGQITKRDVRAITLSALAPRRGELLWDVGAGSGSVAIEWMLADPANRAIAIEARADRTARIARNALALGAPALSVVTGKAPHALADLPPPDAVFVGGGGTAPGADRPGRRRAQARRAARRQRGDARDAGGLGRVARLLGRGARADRDGARRAGRALPRLARRDADRSMALDEAMTPFPDNRFGLGTAPPVSRPPCGGGSGWGVALLSPIIPFAVDGRKSMARPPSLALPHRGEGTRSPARGKAAIPPRIACGSAGTRNSAYVAIGVGCRAGVSGEAIAALVRRALAEFGAPDGERRLFTLAAKAEEAGLVEAARLVGARLTPLPLAALAAQVPRILTPSPAVQARFGVPAVAEAAALAGAGPGGKLLGPRLAADGATCAVALSAELS